MTLYHFRTIYLVNFFQLDKRFFQTSASNTPKSVSKKSKKTMILSNDLHVHTDESSFTKTQPLMLNPNKEDKKTSIKVSIIVLGVACIILFVLYIISYFIKSNKHPVNRFSSAIEEREIVGKWNCKNLQKSISAFLFHITCTWRTRNN